MSIFDRFTKKNTEYLKAENFLKMLTAYTPRFTSWNGCIYESELVRSSIDAIARNISKLKVEIIGSAKPQLKSRLKLQPNGLQTWSQFMYRTATILYTTNTCFIVPLYDEYGMTVGFVPINPQTCELVTSDKGTLWIRYRFSNGQTGAVEYSKATVLTRHQFKSDFFGDSNIALNETMNLIHMQNQGIEEGVKNSSTYRFMAQLTNFSKAEDLANERKRFTEENLKSDKDNGGLLLFPNTYKDIKQVDAKPFTIDAEQMKLIQTNVFNYFGVNEKILQGSAVGDEFSAFYESTIEPFAVQFSEAMTKTIYSDRERAQGNQLALTSNRLQFMTNKDKLSVTSQLLDRGIFTLNEVREIWNLPSVDGGDVRVIRGEYYNTDDKVEEQGESND